MALAEQLQHLAISFTDIFSGPTCSDSHIPGFISHPKIKSAGKVFVVSVNDAFVYVPIHLYYEIRPHN